jgi:hypothetical protein
MTSSQKKALLVGLLALLPAYFFAVWRYDVNHSSIEATRERETQMRESDQKLLTVCQETGLTENNSFDSNGVLCKQAQERHKLQESVFQKLEEEQERTQRDVYWNFILVWLLVNAAAQMVMRWAAIQEKMGD